MDNDVAGAQQQAASSLHAATDAKADPSPAVLPGASEAAPPPAPEEEMSSPAVVDAPQGPVPYDRFQEVVAERNAARQGLAERERQWQEQQQRQTPQQPAVQPPSWLEPPNELKYPVEHENWLKAEWASLGPNPRLEMAKSIIPVAQSLWQGDMMKIRDQIWRRLEQELLGVTDKDFNPQDPLYLELTRSGIAPKRAREIVMRGNTAAPDGGTPPNPAVAEAKRKQDALRRDASVPGPKGSVARGTVTQAVSPREAMRKRMEEHGL